MDDGKEGSVGACRFSTNIPVMQSSPLTGRGDRYSIRLGEIRALRRRFAAYHAHPRGSVIREWNYAASRFGLFANPRLARWIPAPMDVGESTAETFLVQENESRE